MKIDVTVDEMDENLYFSEESMEDNGISTYYYQHIKEYADAYVGVLLKTRDSVYMDSLRTHVFPSIRENVLKANHNLFHEKPYTIIGLSNLKQMLTDRYVFNQKYLSAEDKQSITNYFNIIDEPYTHSPDYTVVNSHIKRMNAENFGNGFMDFSLPNIEGEEVTLSEIIAANEYTILDFWWSGCAPCRRFNRESEQHYKKLKENGIEIISINVDDGRSKWKKASEKDEIEWLNLYAGANSKIEADYHIVAFPTKLVFDRNKQPVNFKFREALELLVLTKKDFLD